MLRVGRYYRLPEGHTAELALVVEDAYHGKGTGTRLIELLANVARGNGIMIFEADVLAVRTKK